MSSPPVVVQPGPLCRLPPIILENIGLEVTVVDPLGPPTDLIALLQTCRHVYHSLSFDNNRHLYARIFRCKFDTRAAIRRFGPRAAYTSPLAHQLKVYSACLKRIRRADIMSPTLEADLYTCFFMMVESDGKNEVQLIEWAGLKTFIDRLVRERLWESRDVNSGWPAESNFNAFVLWLMWFTTDQETLQNESPEDRRRLMELVRPYVVLPIRYPSFHAPDNHFELPLGTSLQDQPPYTHITPHGFYPPYRHPNQVAITRTHFTLPLEIARPPITLAAKMLYFARSESTPFEYPTDIPFDRADAIAQGITRPMPTQEDYRNFNEHKGARVLERGDWDWRAKLDAEEGRLEDDGRWRNGLKAKSARWDNDWHRWCNCFDPWNVPELKGIVYTYGSLNGDWLGRMLIPDITQYFNMVTSPNFVPHVPAMTTVPISLRLREFHCINPEFPIPPGGAPLDGSDDGLCNAWFPTDVEIRETSKGIRIHDPRYGGSHSYYERFREGRPNGHNEETCSECKIRKEQERLHLELRMRANRQDGEDTDMGDDSMSDNSDNAEQRRQRQERLKILKHLGRSPSMRRRPTDGPQEAAGPGVTRPDGPSSGVEPGDVQASEFSFGDREVDSILDDEMGNVKSDLEDFMDNTCNGIQDIVITGETIPSHGQAWQHYRFYGRIRRWDGLIALVRKPAHVPELGIVVFRGYLVANQNLVGNWRAYTMNAHAIPLEGPFIASRSLTQE